MFGTGARPPGGWWIRTILLAGCLGCPVGASLGAFEPGTIQTGANPVYGPPGLIAIREDATASLSFAEARGGNFALVSDVAPSFGFSDAAYWVRLPVENLSPREDWLIQLGSPRLRSVTFFEENESGVFQALETGSGRTFASRELDSRHFLFRVKIKKGETRVFYFRVASETSIQISVQVWQPDAFRSFELQESLVFGLVLGAHLLLFLYNMAIGVYLRSRVFFVYSALVLSAIFFYSSTYGFAFQYLFPNHPDLALNANLIGLGALAGTGVEFARMIVDTSRSRFFGLVLRPFLPVMCFLPVGLFFFSYGEIARSMILTAVLSFGPLLLVTLYGIIKRQAGARYFLVALGSYGVGVVLYALVGLGLLPVTAVTQYGLVIGATLSATILSLSLANQVRILWVDREAALAANRFKTDFLSVMSHEIRTPLTAIVGMSRLLTEDISRADRETYGKVLRESGERLVHLVNQVLDFARIEEGKIVLEQAPFSTSEVLENVAHLFRPSAEAKGLALSVVNECADVVFLGDSARLSQVLMNLVANAVKFSDHGEIKIRAWKEPARAGHCVPVHFAVEDTGIGVPVEQRDLIFNSFVQGDAGVARRHGGSGLGLTIVDGIVKLMEGTMRVEDNHPRGAIFRFSIPLEVSRTPVTPPPAATEPADVRPLRILVAEDEEANRLLVGAFLRKGGHTLEFAHNGKEALAYFETNTYDLILVDIQMPEMDGLTTVRHMRASASPNADLPIYAMTANALPSDIANSRAAGFTGHIAKPYKKEDLLDIVARAGAGEISLVDFR